MTLSIPICEAQQWKNHASSRNRQVGQSWPDGDPGADVYQSARATMEWLDESVFIGLDLSELSPESN